MMELIHWSALLHIRITRFIRKCLDSSQRSHPDIVKVAEPLCAFTLARAQTIITLVEERRLWDAEIICRSLTEAVLKLSFICCNDNNERANRIREYTRDMVEIEDLRRSDRCRQILADADTPEFHKMLDPLLLPAEEDDELRRKWTKAARTKLEQKWSFLASICALEQDRRWSKEGPLGFRALLHQYVYATHFIHADQTALDLLWDRASRPSREREKLEESHAVRLLSDALWLSFVMWPIVAYAVGVPASQAEEYEELTAEVDKLSKRFTSVKAEFWAIRKAADRDQSSGHSGRE